MRFRKHKTPKLVDSIKMFEKYLETARNGLRHFSIYRVRKRYGWIEAFKRNFYIKGFHGNLPLQFAVKS